MKIRIDYYNLGDYCKNKNINLIEIDYRMKKQQIIELLTKTFKI